ncbi:hypothetical protein TNCV_3813921 [Trichonephila clavipes]|nr:hypothetical protein TNCV_3813921 [Trichonephila clavipes]
MLNHDEIVTSVQEPDSVDDETDEDEDNNSNESSKGPSNADCPASYTACRAFSFQLSEQSRIRTVPIDSEKRRSTG